MRDCPHRARHLSYTFPGKLVRHSTRIEAGMTTVMDRPSKIRLDTTVLFDAIRSAMGDPLLIFAVFGLALLLLMNGCAHTNTSNVSRSLPKAAPAEKGPVKHGKSQLNNTPDSSEQKYIYAVGYGKVPANGSSPSAGWARAKRAALDSAYANLLLKAQEESECPQASHTPVFKSVSMAPERPAIHGMAKHIETVSVERLQDGTCRIIVRVPKEKVLIEKR